MSRPEAEPAHPGDRGALSRARHQGEQVEGERDIGLDFVRFKAITGAKHQQLVAARVGAGPIINFIKAEQLIIEGLANRRLVLAPQEIPV